MTPAGDDRLLRFAEQMDVLATRVATDAFAEQFVQNENVEHADGQATPIEFLA